MRSRVLQFGLIGVLSGVALAAEAQAPDGGVGNYIVPRTEWGHPDLQGNWSNATLTPLERREGQGPTLSEAEVASIEGARQASFERGLQPSDPDRPLPPVGGDGSTGAAGGVGGYNSVYVDPGERIALVDGEYRTSLVTSPANGRLPPIKDEMQQRLATERATSRNFGQYDNPENRPLGERCIISFGSNAGPPMLPNGFYNNNYTIVQNENYVMVMSEMNHDARIIQLGEQKPLPDHMRPWFGDSWGRWEGEMLVVETTNIHPLQRFQGMPSEKMKVIERFRRMGDETIVYEFTVENPTVYTESWGGQIPMIRMDDLLYEYACHEGNYALSNVLSGARAEERRQAGGDQQ